VLAVLLSPASAPGEHPLPNGLPCQTDSPAMLEAARILREEPERVFPDGLLFDRPSPLWIRFQQRGNIALVVDESYELIPRDMDWEDGEQVARAKGNLINAFYRTFEDKYDFVAFFTARELTGLTAFYSPLSNDVTGIGYQHTVGEETFDWSDGALELQGILVMNNYRNYLGPMGNPMGRMTFIHEFGHRWLFRVRSRIDGGESDEVLGRQAAHYSYFVHTGGSVMDGNVWEDLGNGTYQTHTLLRELGYGSLDLYLMGFLSEEEADRDGLFLIRQPRCGRQKDMHGRSLWPESPPQIDGNDKVVGGVRHEIRVQDVIAVEGPRVPPFEEAAREFRMAFVLVLRPAHGLRDADFDAFDTMRREMAAEWMAATGGVATLRTYLGDRHPLGGGCRFGSDCDPDDDARCGAPSEGADKLCLPRCAREDGCPESWCCDGDPTDEEALCLPEEHCGEETEDAGTDETGADGGAGLDDAGGGLTDSGPASGDAAADAGAEGEGEGGDAGPAGSGGGVTGVGEIGCGCTPASGGPALRWLPRRR